MDIIHAEPIAPLLCDHCNVMPATRWTNDKDGPHDPCCERCFEELFGECDRCHQPTLLRELVSVTVARQTRMDPAEYEDWCENCAAEPDPQGSRDDEGD
jgi:hypothetical protein